ncbi:hypothetical protein QN277_024165 [Acacia crassicarpa]|uniref:Malectin-like domain-containing protein n=1 Tax=Acacia crassicarpa TaxID=499986 RepID=A0AAE1JD43_9FABA|nr:hypothetical protein QN277_024165 [Acacia crassicarpa]
MFQLSKRIRSSRRLSSQLGLLLINNNMKMKENKTLQWLPLFLVLASSFFLLTSSEEAQADTSNSDGIRIDCGARENYTDPKTKSSYEADFGFVEYGETHNVPSNYTKEQIGNQLKTLRCFPKGKRNCYTVPITPSNNGNTYYVVRTFFAYGNYCNNGTIPSFDLYIGVNYWATFNESSGDIDASGGIVRFEVIHVSSTDKINVCLVNTGHGTPFISLLEVFPWLNSRYDQTASSFLRLMSRSKLGMSENDTYIRYPDDIYGRSWFNRKMENSVIRNNTSLAIDSNTSENTYKLPKEVLSSAVQSVNACSSLVINMVPYSDHDDDYYVYLHFNDFVKKSQNQQRKMVISFSDGVTVSFALEHLKPTTLVRNFKRDDIKNISIRSTSDQLPAMLNAYEIYGVLPQQQVNSTTNEGDVVAIQDIKGAYGIRRISWQGDPCGPMDWIWEGLICNNNTGTPRITSINLSFSHLTGEINGSFSNFLELEVLNLTNNSLTGKIPESLAEPSKLSHIILTGNEIKGPIPPSLVQKIKAGKLIISVDNLEDPKNDGNTTIRKPSNPPTTIWPPQTFPPSSAPSSTPSSAPSSAPSSTPSSTPSSAPSSKVGAIVGGSSPPSSGPSSTQVPKLAPYWEEVPPQVSPPNPTPSSEVCAIVGGTVGGSAVIAGLAYTLKVRFGLRFDICKKRKQRKNESRSGKKNDEERRSGEKKEDCESEDKNDEERRSGEKKEDRESEDKTTVSARVKATNNTGEGGSESLISKARDCIQEQIPCL